MSSLTSPSSTANRADARPEDPSTSPRSQRAGPADEEAASLSPAGASDGGQQSYNGEENADDMDRLSDAEEDEEDDPELDAYLQVHMAADYFHPLSVPLIMCIMHTCCWQPRSHPASVITNDTVYAMSACRRPWPLWMRQEEGTLMRWGRTRMTSTTISTA